MYTQIISFALVFIVSHKIKVVSLYIFLLFLCTKYRICMQKLLTCVKCIKSNKDQQFGRGLTRAISNEFNVQFYDPVLKILNAQIMLKTVLYTIQQTHTRINIILRQTKSDNSYSIVYYFVSKQQIMMMIIENLMAQKIYSACNLLIKQDINFMLYGCFILFGL